ncbi:sugar kinase [Paraoerskovia sediminicola]|uniref:Sugar kinase n=1 Tax=Paraoerskovia sediminicola TaxID=1138587 RepID=A0ABM8G1X7_9CELL|nr:PfkB family carbohydrate kinase [Paraoerskovia sediminicola]BDZ42113.1 sugar kinase [Paraoerskovia sediminicola]
MEPADSSTPVDVLLAGPVYFDLILADVGRPPRPGTEVYAQSMATSPGGIANLAVATARLGLGTALATVLGDDVYGRWCAEYMGNREGIDLSRSRIAPGWLTPVTVSIASGDDRSMVTHEEVPPISVDELVAGPANARAALADLGAMARSERTAAWWDAAAASGTRIFADIGWDATERWDRADLAPLSSCHAFTPNASEAMAYTRTGTALDAARALSDLTPLTVVTCGSAGAVAVSSATGEQVTAPPVPVQGRDATGAGDVFAAALVVGSSEAWPLEQCLSFAALCASLSVGALGGALAAPGWGDVADWWDDVRTSGERDTVARFGFLDDVVPDGALRRRADNSYPFAGCDTAPLNGGIPLR